MCDSNLGSGSQYDQMEMVWQLPPMCSIGTVCLQKAAVRLLYSMLAKPYRQQGQVMVKVFLS